MRSIVIVGASLAGLSAAHRLRDLGFDGSVTLVGDESHLPYQRPPLSKGFLTGDWDRPRINLPIRGDFQWKLGTRAQRLDTAARRIELSDGDALSYDGLIIATGARPRMMPGSRLEGVFTLRTVEDAIAIRERVAGGARKAAIVGAGFIGCEVAAALRKLGCDVTLIESDTVPLRRVLGEQLGEICAELHRSHGVAVQLGVGVDSLRGTNTVEGVRLKDGSLIEAELVVAGIGVIPNVEWLEGSGLTLENGVVCDAACFAAEHIVAAGDVARWDHPRYGLIRVEHWDNAIVQGEAAAAALLAKPGEAQPFAMIPFFWSDQYDSKLQLIGWPQPGDELRVTDGALGERRVAAVFLRDGNVTAAFLLNNMHRLLEYKKLVAP